MNFNFTLRLQWRLSGVLQLPWRPVVAPVDGTSVFTVNDQGLISKKVDYWSTSPGEAVVETFLPGWGREKEAA